MENKIKDIMQNLDRLNALLEEEESPKEKRHLSSLIEINEDILYLLTNGIEVRFYKKYNEYQVPRFFSA